LNNNEIADKLFVGISTVKKHITHLYSKLDVTTRTQAVLKGQELGLVDTPFE
jgi:ATP/maltotriose-dependent transcriptional regulator MalT